MYISKVNKNTSIHRRIYVRIYVLTTLASPGVDMTIFSIPIIIYMYIS
jgi:hypothetical protein